MYRDDFVRRMQDSGIDRRRGRSLHIDLPLLAILITLCGVGLIVLYSASGQNLFYVKRQALLMLVGFGVMFGTAQFAVRFWQRWSIA